MLTVTSHINLLAGSTLGNHRKCLKWLIMWTACTNVRNRNQDVQAHTEMWKTTVRYTHFFPLFWSSLDFLRHTGIIFAIPSPTSGDLCLTSPAYSFGPLGAEFERRKATKNSHCPHACRNLGKTQAPDCCRKQNQDAGVLCFAKYRVHLWSLQKLQCISKGLRSYHFSTR